MFTRLIITVFLALVSFPIFALDHIDDIAVKFFHQSQNIERQLSRFENILNVNVKLDIQNMKRIDTSDSSKIYIIDIGYFDQFQHFVKIDKLTIYVELTSTTFIVSSVVSSVPQVAAIGVSNDPEEFLLSK